MASVVVVAAVVVVDVVDTAVLVVDSAACSIVVRWKPFDREALQKYRKLHTHSLSMCHPIHLTKNKR